MGKSGSHSAKKKTPKAKPGPDLLYLALRSLRLRYQRIANDIKDWQRLHSSHMLNRYTKQIDSVTAKIGYKKTDQEEFAKDSNHPPGVHSRLTDIEKYENQIENDFSPENIPEFFKCYQEWVKDLSGRANNLPRLSQNQVGFQTNWEYFKQALQQRLMPEYGYFLEKVDMIARDCYYPLLKAFEDITGKQLDQKRGWLSPVAVLKFDTIYYTLSTRYTPIPYIFIPFDRMDNIWNLCAIHHEVAHDFFHKLNYLVDPDEITPSLLVAETFANNVRQNMKKKNLTAAETAVAQYVGEQSYIDWLEEIFADFIGLILAGPVYLCSLQEIQVDENVAAREKKYPPIYFRMLLNAIIAGDKLGFKQEAETLRRRWADVYGEEKILAGIRNEVNQEKKKPKNKYIDKLLKPNQTVDPNLDDLTLQGIKQWLTRLVDSCWEASLAPADQEKLTLQKIYAQLIKTDYEKLADLQAVDKRRKKQGVVNDTLRKNICNTREQLKAIKRAECRPRYLVPAVRLAYEAWILNKTTVVMESSDCPDRYSDMEIDWDQQIQEVFFDSVRELPEVADAFKQYENAWKWDDEGRDFWNESRFDYSFNRQMVQQAR